MLKEVLLDFDFDEMSEILKGLGEEKKFRAKQLYSALNQGLKLEEVTTLPKELIAKLKEKYQDAPIEIYKELTGKDETKKFIYKLQDGALIEGVLMKYKYGFTLCVSTQVGCRMGCKFCCSTRDGLIRNLSAGEILGQVVTVNRHIGGKLGDKRKITNIVLMGSGEPFDNYANVTKFLRLVNDENGLNISQRNISLSTCGLVPKIKQFADEGNSATLTISLHNPFDEKRKEIMPIANAYSIDEILGAAKYYFDKTKRRVIFEYALIAGQNDGDECIQEIVKKFKNFSFHFNIIPLNENDNKTLKSAGRKGAYRFAEKLEKMGISATVRRTMGEDIGGACGQLRNKISSNM